MHPTVQESETQSPLAATLARVTALEPAYFASHIGIREAGWFPATALHAADSPQLGDGLARQVAQVTNAETRVMGSFFIGTYTWHIAAAAIAAYLTERRVPDLDPVHMMLRYCTLPYEEEGETGEEQAIHVRFVSERFAVLPDDPASNHPAALLFSTQVALRTWLRTSLEAHLTPVIEALYTRTHLSKRAQWNLVADTCAELFLTVGEKSTALASCCAEGLSFVQAAGSPMQASHTGYVTVTAGDHQQTFRTRGGCCLYYRTDPGNNCSSCPLRSDEERIARFQHYLAKKYSVESVERTSE